MSMALLWWAVALSAGCVALVADDARMACAGLGLTCGGFVALFDRSVSTAATTAAMVSLLALGVQTVSRRR